jgi:carbonic anhydrase
MRRGDNRKEDAMKDKSPILREMVDKGQLAIVGAMLDVKTGKVNFFDKI